MSGDVRRLQGDGIELAVRDQGEGPAVLLLHGFPDTSRLWRHQIAALTAAGMRAVAPDLRGRGASGRPAAVEDYALRRSVADAVAVLDALGIERAHVAGHDFGAVVAWLVATWHPERVDRLAVMSVGHPDTVRTRTIASREKAWYTLLFQFEGLAEELLTRDGWALFREWLRDEGDAAHYLEELARPGALTAGLNWYRANLHPRTELSRRPPLPPVAADVLGLWSSGDHYLTEDRMLASGDHVAGTWRYERVDGASHWLQLDEPERVNALLLGFLA